jgi:thiamine-phosphate pyrophosphorylase
VAAEFKSLRYQTYTLHRAVATLDESLTRLAAARLYVLFDGGNSSDEMARIATTLVGAGVDLIQLRDKRLDDRELLARARRLAEIVHSAGKLLIVNDRPDIARLARADGVHVGQEELSVKDVRTIVGPRWLIGVSTHSLSQARQAVLDGADYIGVGPTFPSDTKSFAAYPGLTLLREVAAEIRLPAFAIGGITPENLPTVLAAGFRRVAVASAIVAATNPASVARQMRAAVLGARP